MTGRRERDRAVHPVPYNLRSRVWNTPPTGPVDDGDTQGFVDPQQHNIPPLPPVDDDDSLIKELNKYKVILVRNGLKCPHLFTESEFVSSGFTLATYVEALRAVFKDKDNDDIEALFEAGRNGRILKGNPIISIDMPTWAHFLNWVHGADGRVAIATAHNNARSWISFVLREGFIHMRNNYLDEIKFNARRAERNIKAIRATKTDEEEIENEIDIVMEKIEVDLESLCQQFAPASTYEPPLSSANNNIDLSFIYEDYHDLFIDYSLSHVHSMSWEKLTLQPLPKEPPLGPLLLPLWRKRKMKGER